MPQSLGDFVMGTKTDKDKLVFSLTLLQIPSGLYSENMPYTHSSPANTARFLWRMENSEPRFHVK